MAKKSRLEEEMSKGLKVDLETIYYFNNLQRLKIDLHLAVSDSKKSIQRTEIKIGADAATMKFGENSFFRRGSLIHWNFKTQEMNFVSHGQNHKALLSNGLEGGERERSQLKVKSKVLRRQKWNGIPGVLVQFKSKVMDKEIEHEVLFVENEEMQRWAGSYLKVVFRDQAELYSQYGFPVQVRVLSGKIELAKFSIKKWTLLKKSPDFNFTQVLPEPSRDGTLQELALRIEKKETGPMTAPRPAPIINHPKKPIQSEEIKAAFLMAQPILDDVRNFINSISSSLTGFRTNPVGDFGVINFNWLSQMRASALLVDPTTSLPVRESGLYSWLRQDPALETIENQTGADPRVTIQDDRPGLLDVIVDQRFHEELKTNRPESLEFFVTLCKNLASTPLMPPRFTGICRPLITDMLQMEDLRTSLTDAMTLEIMEAASTLGIEKIEEWFGRLSRPTRDVIRSAGCRKYFDSFHMTHPLQTDWSSANIDASAFGLGQLSLASIRLLDTSVNVEINNTRILSELSYGNDDGNALVIPAEGIAEKGQIFGRMNIPKIALQARLESSSSSALNALRALSGAACFILPGACLIHQILGFFIDIVLNGTRSVQAEMSDAELVLKMPFSTNAALFLEHSVECQLNKRPEISIWTTGGIELLLELDVTLQKIATEFMANVFLNHTDFLKERIESSVAEELKKLISEVLRLRFPLDAVRSNISRSDIPMDSLGRLDSQGHANQSRRLVVEQARVKGCTLGVESRLTASNPDVLFARDHQDGENRNLYLETRLVRPQFEGPPLVAVDTRLERGLFRSAVNYRQARVGQGVSIGKNQMYSIALNQNYLITYLEKQRASGRYDHTFDLNRLSGLRRLVPATVSAAEYPYLDLSCTSFHLDFKSEVEIEILCGFSLRRLRKEQNDSQWAPDHLHWKSRYRAYIGFGALTPPKEFLFFVTPDSGFFDFYFVPGPDTAENLRHFIPTTRGRLDLEAEPWRPLINSILQDWVNVKSCSSGLISSLRVQDGWIRHNLPLSAEPGALKIPFAVVANSYFDLSSRHYYAHFNFPLDVIENLIGGTLDKLSEMSAGEGSSLRGLVKF